MEQPVEQPCYCQVVWKEKRARCLNILIKKIYTVWILVIFRGHNIVNELNYTICSENIPYLFKILNTGVHSI